MNRTMVIALALLIFIGIAISELTDAQVTDTITLDTGDITADGYITYNDSEDSWATVDHRSFDRATEPSITLRLRDAKIQLREGKLHIDEANVTAVISWTSGDKTWSAEIPLTAQ